MVIMKITWTILQHLHKERINTTLLHNIKSSLALFKKAYITYKSGREAFTENTRDSDFVNYAGYLIHQSVLYTLRGYLTLAGNNFSAMGSASELVYVTKHSESKCIITDWILQNADTLSAWNNSSVAGVDPKYLSTCIDNVYEFLKANGVCKKLCRDITSSDMQKIRQCVPSSIRLQHPIEWNTLYVAMPNINIV